MIKLAFRDMGNHKNEKTKEELDKTQTKRKKLEGRLFELDPSLKAKSDHRLIDEVLDGYKDI